jgi:hypothetical protein
MIRRSIAFAAFAATFPLASTAFAQTAPDSAAAPPPATPETASTMNPSAGLEVDESGKNRPATGFGRQGQFALSTDFQLSFGLRLQKEPADQEQEYPFSLSAPDQGDRATAPGSSEGAASPNSLA